MFTIYSEYYCDKLYSHTITITKSIVKLRQH